MNQYYKNCLNILNKAIKQNISVADSCRKFNRSTDYVSTFCRRINERLNNNSITKIEADKILELYDQAKKIRINSKKNTKKLSL